MPKIFKADVKPQYERQGTIEVAKGTTINYRLFYVTTGAQVLEAVEYLKQHKSFGLDLETSGLNPREGKIATLQVGTPRGNDPRAYVIDVRCVTAEELAPLFDLLRDKSYTKYGQNLKFECKWLIPHYGVHVRGCRDTQITELILRCGLFESKNGYQGGNGNERAAYKWCSMHKLASRYLGGIDIDKDHDLRVSFYDTPAGYHTERQIAYAAGDVIYPFYIDHGQRTLIDERNLLGVLKIEWALIPVLADAESTGLYIDTARWRALWQEAVKMSAETQRQLDDLFRPITLQPDLFQEQNPHVRPIFPKRNVPLNYGSSEHKLWAIKEYCKSINWPHEIVTSTVRAISLKKEYGQEWMDWQLKNGRKPEWKQVPDHLVPESQYCLLLDTNKDTLKLRALRGQLPHKMVKLLTDYSMYEKRATAFGLEFLKKNVTSDGRMHTEIHQAATATGRKSTTPNTQNIPKDPRYRECFRAPKGRKLCIADYSQIEPRLSAQVSKDPTYMAAFHTADDIYLTVATEMFGERPDKKTPEGALTRHIAKIIVLQLAYRAGPAKLRDFLTLGLAEYIQDGSRKPPTMEEATKLWKQFFEACSGVKAFQEECSMLASHKDTQRPKIYDEFLGAEVTYIQAPCGRIRFFPPDAKGTYTEGPNAPIQGASATITKAAIVLIQDEIDRRGWDAHLINAVHDEVVYEVEESIAVEFALVMKERMEYAGQFYLPDVPVIAEFPENTNGVVDYWTKKVDLLEAA